MGEISVIPATYLRSEGDRARCFTMGFRAFVCLTAVLLASAGRPALAAQTVSVVEAVGDVTARGPAQSAYSRVRTGDRIGHGSRLRTGASGKVTLRFVDGTEARVMPKSEVVVRAPGALARRPNGVVLFFGRLWTGVVRSVAGQEAFEVRSANAVAGVRGTRFEVGVADDGATMVVVSEGRVDVEGDAGDRAVQIKGGFRVQSDERGRLGDPRKAPESMDWEGWFAARAKVLEQRGQAVAENLHGRLERRESQVRRLLARQKRLRGQIEALERRQRAGEDVRAELKDKLRELERVTARLEDMQRRLQAVFGIFDMWGRKAAGNEMPSSPQMRLLVEDVKRVEKGFADLFEEGTDQSEEGMNEMMEDMQQGPTLKPKKKAKDELF